ncbi:MAG: macro domain-containing protein [Anaerococcus hydrogenalis]|uniref:macro domain-containing protein n=1 Tax=Anaerococcus hydrogenalis TaxID=33029 RepID=UPI0028FED1A3|nr:macro domain-containing protein [Anaerococcus hydrogenalis]MDU2582428.1 macro domain-containing protein [Anaerococcus hydrogenalis]
MTLKVVDLDILKLNVDAIVNAANIDLIEGGGICGQIFEKAGRDKLKKACQKLSPIKPGQAVITDGFGLNQKFIIHAVGPIYNEVYKEACQKILKNAYKNTLELAKKNKINSIAFPLISAGIYGYPEKEAFFIAKNTIDEFLEENEMDVYLSTYGKDILSLIMG